MKGASVLAEERSDAAPVPAASSAPRPRSLADQQVALVAALTGNGPIPPGFDSARVRAAADALAAKRARTVGHAWPGLRSMLGPDFRVRFDAYAARTPLPEPGGPLADGRMFVRELAAALPLIDEIALQTLDVDQRWRATPRGLVPRRLPRFGVVRSRSLRCVVIAFGERKWRVPLPPLRR